MPIFKKNKKVGLALGGGGVKGLAHIGVIKVLEQNKIPIDYITGTSIGAMIGGHYAAHKDIAMLEDLAIDSSNWKLGLSLMDPDIKGGFLRGEKVEKYISDMFKGVTFENLKIPFCAVATDLRTGLEIDINSGDIVKAVRASIAVPPIFKPVNYKGMLLSDGGLCNPVPDNLVQEMGADIVIAVNLDQLRVEEKFTGNKPIMDISIRSLNILRYYLSQYCLQEADVIIEPNIDEPGLVGFDKFFSKEKVLETIKIGEEAAKREVGKIKKLLR